MAGLTIHALTDPDRRVTAPCYRCHADRPWGELITASDNSRVRRYCPPCAAAVLLAFAPW